MLFGSGGVVLVVWSIFVMCVVMGGGGGVVDIVLQRLLLPSKSPSLHIPSFYLAKFGFHLLTLFHVGS